MATFDELIETGRLMAVVPRRDMRKWAAYVTREMALRPGTARVSIIREHLSALDAKAGTLAGIAGALLAGCTFFGGWAFGDHGPSLQPLGIALFGFAVFNAVMSGVYAMSALSVEQPEDASSGDDDAFTFRLLQRLVYRARNHGWGLRTAQISAGSLVMAAGSESGHFVAELLFGAG